MSSNYEARIDPEVATILSAAPLALGGLTDEALPLYRSGMADRPAPELSDRVERTDHTVSAGPDGYAPVVRVHRPKAPARNGGTRPCVYWIHGGGYVLGTYEGDDLRFDDWCQRFDCVGVSVEYRLAPETPYPGPLEDCYAGLKWTHANAATLGIDPNRIGIGGQSAGSGLAAGLALLARDRGEVPLQFQVLIYPMLDDRMQNPSHQWPDPVWPPAANQYGWRSYLGSLFGRVDVPIYAAAARATDLSGLPPTIITVGACDGFVDEDIDYAARLNRAGVPTELHVYPGGPHGFDGLAANSAIGQQARRDIDMWVERALTSV